MVADGAVDDVVGEVGDANVVDIDDVDDVTVDDIGGGWFLDEGWRSVDGMLPVNTAGSPGGGLQWPSRGGGDVVELAMQTVWMQMWWIQYSWYGSWWQFGLSGQCCHFRSAGLALFGQALPFLVPEGLLP